MTESILSTVVIEQVKLEPKSKSLEANYECATSFQPSFAFKFEISSAHHWWYSQVISKVRKAQYSKKTFGL